MTTLGWLLIGLGAWFVRAMMKGQVFDGSGQFVLFDNLSSTVLAIITGDRAKLAATNAGEPTGIVIRPESQFGGSDEADTNGTGNFGGTDTVGKVKIDNGPVTPTMQHATDVLASKFGVEKPGTYNGHIPSRERAVDFPVDSTSQGNALAMYARAHHDELGVTQVIWNKQIWTKQRDKEDWREYKPITNKGDFMHEHHVHVTC